MIQLSVVYFDEQTHSTVNDFSNTRVVCQPSLLWFSDGMQFTPIIKWYSFCVASKSIYRTVHTEYRVKTYTVDDIKAKRQRINMRIEKKETNNNNNKELIHLIRKTLHVKTEKNPTWMTPNESIKWFYRRKLTNKWTDGYKLNWAELNCAQTRKKTHLKVMCWVAIVHFIQSLRSETIQWITET